MSNIPASLMEAVRTFSDLDVCEDKMAHMKWTDGKPQCPDCGSHNIGRRITYRQLCAIDDSGFMGIK